MSASNFTQLSISSETKYRIKSIVYGNCIGDALGLLTEFMDKSKCEKYYRKYIRDGLRYGNKIPDGHRTRWDQGDWTDDSDQMICIMQSLSENREILENDIAKRILDWSHYGFRELGDISGLGIGRTTYMVLTDKNFPHNPTKSAKKIWNDSCQKAAPNGGVMRTSILGIYEFNDLNKVAENAVRACSVTHADPRCLASCVAVTRIIAQMLQQIQNNGKIEFSDDDIKNILQETRGFTVDYIFNNEKYTWDLKSEGLKEMKEEFIKYFKVKKKDGLEFLKLDDHPTIGYTLKCMGSGIWALKQDSPTEALTRLIMEGGDADTNGAVAGALLGCRYGLKRFPDTWIDELAKTPREFLDKTLEKFITKNFVLSQ